MPPAAHILRSALFALSLVACLSCGGRGRAVEMRFGNSIEQVHPDEVEAVQFCRKAGIGYNLDNQTSNPGGGGIVDTDQGRLIVLYLRDQNPLTVEQMAPLKKATELSHFNCPGWFDDERLGFFTHPGRFTKVTGLSIAGSKITGEGLKGLKNFPKLASLNVHSRSLTDEDVRRICEIPTIHFLRLHAPRVTDKGVSYLANLPRLFHLELNTTQTTDAGLEHLAHLPELKTLYLDETKVTGPGLQHLAGLEKLRMLSLNKTPLTDRGLGELAERPGLDKVEVLYLADTDITDAGCPAFARLINLKVLTLSGTKVTDRGIRHIKSMPQLYNITFPKGVTDAGIRWLAENAEISPSLESQLLHKLAPDRRPPVHEELAAFHARLDGAEALAFQLGFRPTDSKTSAARERLLEMKTEAVAPILEMVKTLHEKEHPLARYYGHRTQLCNEAAGILAKVCDEAMPTLVDHYAELNALRPLISQTLRQTGDDIQPQLERWLTHGSAAVRREGLDQLKHRARRYPLGPGAASASTGRRDSLTLSPEAQQQVYALLADDDAGVRKAAAAMVVVMQDDASAKAKALTAAILLEEDGRHRYYPMQALCDLGRQLPPGHEGLPAVIGGFATIVQSSQRDAAKNLAMRKLGELGGKARATIELLRQYRDGPDPQLSEGASVALRQIARCPVTMMQAADIPVDVQALVFTLTTDDPDDVKRASERLIERGPEMVHPLAVAARGEVGEYYPRKAADIVSQWPQEEVLPRLRPAFAWTGTYVRMFVLNALSRMKWAKLPPIVAESFAGVDAKVRGYAMYDLYGFAKNSTGKAAEETARLIAAELERPGLDWPLAGRLIDSLAQCYPEAKEVPSLLIEILKRDSGHASRYACSELGRLARFQFDELATDRTACVAAISEVLTTTKDDRLRRECVSALRWFGADAKAALPARGGE